jgi:tetratricopeptide (TPR) repeat protein
MTSHIFVATGMWDDVVAANETSWEVADRRVQRRGLDVDQRNFHALFWLEYGYLQQGRYGDAMETLDVMRSDEATSGSRRTRIYLADMRAAYIVGTREWDSDAVRATVDTRDLSPQIQAEDLFATGWSALERGERPVAESTMQEMRRRREAAVNSGRDVYMPGVRAAEVMEKQLQALLARDAGDGDGAVAILNGATAIEDAMPFEFGPPVVVKPSHELLGEVLLELGRPGQARREFERALARTPKKVLALLGLARAAAATGDTEDAAEAYAELRQIWHGADPGLPEVEEAGRFVAGREEEASRE